jgi:Protein of unknown function (DUF2817)
MDFAELGDAHAARGLVLLSATHGVEGFCGSGCQTGLLREAIAAKLARDLHVILVHAHNPYGFARLRRVNEDNIDLNRNYVDHALPHPRNDDYERLADAVAPKALSGAIFEAANTKLDTYAAEHGAFGLQAAMTRGQYTHPDGLFYGGTRPTWSNRTLTAGMTKRLRNKRFAALIDFHTGLGPFGYGEIISEYDAGAAGDARLTRWFGDEAKSTRRGQSVSADLTGTIDGAFERMLPGCGTTAFALEYGTVKSDEVLAATRADNWLHLHGDLKSEQGKAIKREIRRVFYPDTDEWKRLVWARAAEVVERTAQGLLEETE